MIGLQAFPTSCQRQGGWACAEADTGKGGLEPAAHAAHAALGLQSCPKDQSADLQQAQVRGAGRLAAQVQQP